MISVNEAFEKFKSRLELTPSEQEDVSKKHTEMRDFLKSKFPLEDALLTGSYARDTKTKPLKDVDIFCIIKSDSREYREAHPSKVLNDFADVLSKKYGSANVKARRRSVMIKFGDPVKVNGITPDVVLSFDVVPAFTLKDYYEIPDSQIGEWIKSNPFVHAQKATDANKAYSQKWKPLVKMIKKWNQHNDKPVDPSFLLEVMALEIIVPPAPPRLNYQYELKTFLATATERIGEEWNDPAGLGPPVSDKMDASQIALAIQALKKAEQSVTKAILLERQGNIGEALKEWQNLFGPRFSMS